MFPWWRYFHCQKKRLESDSQHYTNNGVLSSVCMYLSLSHLKEENFVPGQKILALYLCSYLSKSDKVSVSLLFSHMYAGKIKHLLSNS